MTGDVGGGIDCSAKPAQSRADSESHGRRILTDAGSEYEGVESIERRGEHAGIETDPIDEVLKRKLRCGVRARLELTHVVALPGEALQTGAVVKQRLDLRRSHVFLVEQVEHHAGV